MTARCLGPSGKGLLTAIAVYPSLVVSFSDMGVRQSAVYFTAKSHYGQQSIINAIATLYLISTSLSVIVAAVLIIATGNVLFTPLMILLAVSIIPFRLFQSYCRGILLGAEDTRSYNRFQWLPAILAAFFTGLFVIFLNGGVNGAQLAGVCAIAPIVFLGLRIFGAKHSLGLSSDWGLIRRIVMMGLLFSTALFIRMLNQRVPVIVLEGNDDVAAIGIFGIGASFAELLTQIPMAVGAIVFSRSANAKDAAVFSKKVAVIFRFVLVLSLVGATVLWFSCDLIMSLLYGDEFHLSATVVRFMLPGVVAMSLFRLLNMDLAGRGKPMLAMFATLPGTIINFSLCFWLVNDYGAPGAAISLSIVNVCVAVCFIMLYLRHTSLSFFELVMFQKQDVDLVREATAKICKKIGLSQWT